MHEPTFRQALSRSWQLVAHKKSLWIFGLLAAVIGQMGLSDFVGMLYKISSNGFLPFDLKSFFSIGTSFEWHRISVVLLTSWLVGILLLLLLAIIFIAVSSRGAIIAYAIHWYKKETVMSLEDAWNKGVKKFFPLLAVTMMSRGFQMIVIYLFSVVAFRLYQNSSLLNNLSLIICASLAMLFALVIESVSVYASGYLMLENISIKKAVLRGWELFLDHILVSLELGVVLLLCSFIFLGVAVYSSFLAYLPSLVMWLLAGFTGFKFLIGLGMYSGIFIYTTMLLVAAGIFNAFVTCSWMYLFMKMHHEGVTSRVFHFFKQLFRRS